MKKVDSGFQKIAMVLQYDIKNYRDSHKQNPCRRKILLQAVNHFIYIGAQSHESMYAFLRQKTPHTLNKLVFDFLKPNIKKIPSQYMAQGKYKFKVNITE